MTKVTNIAIGCIIALILALGALFVISGFAWVTDGLGLLDLVRAEREARIAEIRLESLRAETALENARAGAALAGAQQTDARADLLLHEAAAYTVETNARLVRWYAIRRDVLWLLFTGCAVLPGSIACGVALGTVAYRKWEARKREETLRFYRSF